MSENRRNGDAFAKELAKFELTIDRVAEQCHRAVALDAAARIIQRSPVHPFGPGGSFKGRWALAVNAKPATHAEAPDKSGRATLEKAKAALRQLGPYSFIVLSNNSPQGKVLEFGGYPNPVKRGTRIPGGARARRKLGDDAQINVGPGQFAPRASLGKKAIGGARYVKLSEGGFSRQAPRGIVRISIAEIAQAWPAIANPILAKHGRVT